MVEISEAWAKEEGASAAGIKVGSYISTNAICYSDRIGEGSIVWPNVYIGPDVVIGICNIIKASCNDGKSLLLNINLRISNIDLYIS